MIKEIVIDQDKEKKRQRSIAIAKLLMTLAVYFIIAATMLEYLNPITTLKSLGFLLATHSFYFLWKSYSFQDR